MPDEEKEEREKILTEAGAPFFSATKTATQGFLPGDKEYEVEPSTLSLVWMPWLKLAVEKT